MIYIKDTENLIIYLVLFILIFAFGFFIYNLIKCNKKKNNFDYEDVNFDLETFETEHKI